MGVCSRLYRLVTDCGSCRCFQPTLPPCGCGGRLVSVPLWRLVWWCVAAQHLSVRFPALTPASSGSLLDDLLVAEDARAEEGMVGDIVEPLSSMADLSTPAWKVRSKCRRSHADETCLSADPPCRMSDIPAVARRFTGVAGGCRAAACAGISASSTAAYSRVDSCPCITPCCCSSELRYGSRALVAIMLASQRARRYPWPDNTYPTLQA